MFDLFMGSGLQNYPGVIGDLPKFRIQLPPNFVGCVIPRPTQIQGEICEGIESLNFVFLIVNHDEGLNSMHRKRDSLSHSHGQAIARAVSPNPRWKKRLAFALAGLRQVSAAELRSHC